MALHVGKHICITGKLSKTRKQIEQLIKNAGGFVASGVSKNTDILVVGKDAGSKLDKARELGVTVLNEEDFMSAASFNEAFGEGYYLFTSDEVITLTPEEVERMNEELAKYGMEPNATIENELPKYIHYCYSKKEADELIEFMYDERYTSRLITVTTPVTGYFFDEEDSVPSNGYEVVLNSKKELEIYHDTNNSHGHLVCLWWKDEKGDKHHLGEGGVGDWNTDETV